MELANFCKTWLARMSSIPNLMQNGFSLGPSLGVQNSLLQPLRRPEKCKRERKSVKCNGPPAFSTREKEALQSATDLPWSFTDSTVNDKSVFGLLGKKFTFAVVVSHLLHRRMWSLLSNFAKLPTPCVLAAFSPKRIATVAFTSPQNAISMRRYDLIPRQVQIKLSTFQMPPKGIVVHGRKVEHDYPFALVQSPNDLVHGTSSVPKTPGGRRESRKSRKAFKNQQSMTSSKRQLYLWIAYNVLLYGLIVVSGAILFMVMVGMVHVGDQNAKDDWIEVNSQILNGVFTWMAITNHPFFIYRLVKTLQVLGIRRWNWVSPLPNRIQAARYLSRHFPLVFVDTAAIQEHKLESAETQDDEGEVYLLTEHEETETVEEISYCRGDAENLRNTFVMLNWNCLFQYPITAVMWAYNSDTRPGFVIGVFLPLSFLCNFGGQYRIFKLNRDIKTRRSAAVGGPTQGSSEPTISGNSL